MVRKKIQRLSHYKLNVRSGPNLLIKDKIFIAECILSSNVKVVKMQEYQGGRKYEGSVQRPGTFESSHAKITRAPK